jgi:DNA-binding beta-propeller fold protein YncE
MRAGAVPRLLLVAALVLPGIAVAQQYFVYVGTYKAQPSSGTPPRIAPGRPVAQPSTSQGIYGWRFDTATAAPSPLGVVAKTANPAHVWISPNGKYLDAVNWQENSARMPRGVSAYAIDTNTGALKFFSKQTSAGELPNQVVVSPSGKVAAAVNYKTGNMALFPAHLDGTLGEPFAVIGGNPAHVDGQPRIITTSAGKAVLFDGVHDGLFIETKTHPLGHWYVVTQTYDGQTHRSFVNGVLEKEGPLAYMPQGPGHSFVGLRINHVSHFKGAVMRAHFAPRALASSEFMKVPASLVSAQ